MAKEEYDHLQQEKGKYISVVKSVTSDRIENLSRLEVVGVF